MPSIQTVESFVRLVEEGKTLESMQRYYAENASVRENIAAPRQGKPALIKHEENALAAVKSMKATCLRPILIAENVVVLRWIFEIENLQNKRVRLEELAYQQWSGEHIVEEQFFYDPAQLKMPL